MSNWDVIVIGSGIGGLAAAAALAKENKRVLVLERHQQLGGLTQAFERHGYRFNVGVHYIGGAGDIDGEPGPAKKIFDTLTPAGIPMASMGRVYDRAHFPGFVFDFERPAQRLVASLKAHFPQESDGIDRYFESMREARKALEAVFAAHSMPQIVARGLMWWKDEEIERWVGRTISEVIGRVRQRPEAAGAAGRAVGRSRRSSRRGVVRDPRGDDGQLPRRRVVPGRRVGRVRDGVRAHDHGGRRRTARRRGSRPGARSRIAASSASPWPTARRSTPRA